MLWDKRTKTDEQDIKENIHEKYHDETNTHILNDSSLMNMSPHSDVVDLTNDTLNDEILIPSPDRPKAKKRF